jgi:protein tyrosine phosphatase
VSDKRRIHIVSLLLLDEHSRVRLPELSGDPVTTYINANYIRGWPNESNAYIATQGPLANTVVDFYRMIWQENTPVVVMITRLLERNKV